MDREGSEDPDQALVTELHPQAHSEELEEAVALED